MNNKDLLKKAIEKVEEKGTTNRCFSSWLDYHDEEDIIKYNKHYPIIFDKNFLKLFFGEHEITINIHAGYSVFPRLERIIAWKYYSQQMTLEKEPLKYLEKFL